ncbi:MAG TPA: hypothetical protein VFW76_07520 [Ktedonobacterales bacterium]|nr:hypothetical protein [Ktedonobacterales bacterium]
MRLQFAEAAEQAFVFLSDQYGFHVAHTDPVFVRYQSGSAYINVFHRLKSYQVDLHLGRPEHDPAIELDFELDEFTQLDAVAVDLPILIARTPEKARSALAVIAEECRTYCRPALEGDAGIFERLQAQRIQAAEQLSRAWEAQQDRPSSQR